MEREKILIVAAHPDDEILGCGGTIARLIKEGREAYTVILGEGPKSRYGRKDRKKSEKDLKGLRNAIQAANSALSVKKVFSYDFPDNKFDSVALLDIVKTLEKAKKEVSPRIIFTHHWSDLNIDHRVTFNAVLTACRPMVGETVKEIYSFEVPSSTEWNFPNRFTANIFIDISKTIDAKIRALQCYETELRPFPHPRSLEAIRNNAKRWGSAAGLNCAEAFEAVRVIK